MRPSLQSLITVIAALSMLGTTDFLVQVARKRGRLGKRGVPNIESAAMTVINDWRDAVQLEHLGEEVLR
jgi:ribosome biogenesis GTPase A